MLNAIYFYAEFKMSSQYYCDYAMD